MWTLARVRAVMLLEATLTFSFYLTAATQPTSSTNTNTNTNTNTFVSYELGLHPQSSLLLLVLLTLLRLLLQSWVITFKPLPCQFRRRFSTISFLVTTLVAVLQLLWFTWGPYPTDGPRAHWHGMEQWARSLLMMPIVMSGGVFVSEHWIPTSKFRLFQSEQLLLGRGGIHLPHNGIRGMSANISFLSTCGDSKYLPSGQLKPPLVILHGFAAGKALFFQNLAALSQRFYVYSLDLPGLGGSDRIKFRCDNAESTEQFFVTHLENWVQSQGLERIYLMGHSFGGYIASNYALKFPHRVKKLLLVSPVAIPEPPPRPQHRYFTRWPRPVAELLAFCWQHDVTPQSFVRFLGPFGPLVVNKFMRWRLSWSPGLFTHIDLIADYLMHCNAGPACSDKALNKVLMPGAHARRPLEPRMNELACATHFMYGAHDWMDTRPAYRISQHLNAKGLGSQVVILENSGHQVR
jgi:pimeloyl-ACP methyl ester carboxylesterase